MEEVDTTYSYGGVNGDADAFLTQVANVVPTSVKTTEYRSGMVKATAKSYDAGYGSNLPIFGNVTSESDYDWGSGAQGALLKQTATYDADSNVVTRVEPKANTPGSTGLTTSTYSYDTLNRLLSKVHADPINANSYYGYDGAAIPSCPGPVPPTTVSPTNLVGRRSGMCTNRSASSWSYDQIGRPLMEARANIGPPIQTLNTSYAYYKDGTLNTLTYPSGDVLTYTVGGAGRPTQAIDSSNNYVTAATYAPTVR